MSRSVARRREGARERRRVGGRVEGGIMGEGNPSLGDSFLSLSPVEGHRRSSRCLPETLRGSSRHKRCLAPDGL